MGGASWTSHTEMSRISSRFKAARWNARCFAQLLQPSAGHKWAPVNGWHMAKSLALFHARKSKCRFQAPSPPPPTPTRMNFKETLWSCIWSASSQTAAWCPPQVGLVRKPETGARASRKRAVRNSRKQPQTAANSRKQPETAVNTQYETAVNSRKQPFRRGGGKGAFPFSHSFRLAATCFGLGSHRSAHRPRWPPPVASITLLSVPHRGYARPRHHTLPPPPPIYCSPFVVSLLNSSSQRLSPRAGASQLGLSVRAKAYRSRTWYRAPSPWSCNMRQCGGAGA